MTRTGIDKAIGIETNKELEDQLIRFNKELEEMADIASNIQSRIRFDPLLFLLWRLKNDDNGI